jgi:hypothetical protein
MRQSEMVLVERLEEQGLEDDEDSGIPVCGANLSSPVIDQARYIDEIHYNIGSRKYVENAD